MSEILQWKQAAEQGANPRDYKVKLAQEIIARFHDEQAAVKALESFEARFQRGAMPDEIAEVTIKGDEAGCSITHILKEAGLTSSTSEAIRMINQSAVKIDGEKVSDTKLVLATGTKHVYQVGKRKFARVEIS
jgi:tyrosyl-tRNA synthetase